ncbi:MAG: hypothetical protein AAF696_26685 [Bacteroidota bacterium]
MKYFEYVYLILVLMTLVFLSKEWEILPAQSRTMLILVSGIFVGMYVFRRSRRIKAEQAYLQEIKALQEDLD